jgi:glycosyltransferase involved in cell wall biosynthesis
MSDTPHRKVLVIAYYFPPMGLSGVQRTLKFVKYLPEFGWQPTVLTVTPTGYFAQDYSLLEEIHPHNVAVERAGSLDPNRFFRKKGVVKMPSERWRKILTMISDTFFIPDNKIGWKKKAVKAASKLFEEQNFDVIFATAPPFTDLLIGAELAKKFHKPLVVDYRDPWLDYPTKYYPTPLHRWKNYRLEKEVLRTAARILTTNRRVKELILKRHKFLDYHDVTILPQGYDPADFQQEKLPAPPKKRMRITHAGVFYGDRTPAHFLAALKKVYADHPEMKGRIEATFIGNFQDEYVALVQQMGLEESVTITGYMDHKPCVRHIMSADVLWLMLNNDRQSPGKFYEYLGARKPVLACVPDGFIRQALKEAEGGVIVDPADVDGIAAAIAEYYLQFTSNTLPRPKEEVVAKYDRVQLTNELSKILGFLVD